jgi:hypothetical protein
MIALLQRWLDRRRARELAELWAWSVRIVPSGMDAWLMR